MTVTGKLVYIPAAHYNLCCHSDEGVEKMSRFKEIFVF